MTEAEWLTCDDPNRMLTEVIGNNTGWQVARKLRLIGCACSRRVWTAITDERGRKVIASAERYADNRGSQDALKEARKAALKVRVGTERLPADLLAQYCAWPDPWGTARAATDAPVSLASEGLAPGVVATLLREVFGNPFRPIGFPEANRTPQTRSLAEAACEERQLPSGYLDNTRLAILADALEEAGCDNAEILAHLR